MKLPRILTTVLPALGASLQLVAQQTPPPEKPQEETLVLSAFTVTTKQDRGYRAGNSVSATRINTPIKDLPFQVTAFTQEFITDIGTRELGDIIKYAAGATSGTDGFTSGNSAVSVRNFQSNPQRNGFAAPFFVDGSNIERVEIVKGPASMFYGQIQPGGVVNYITKKPTAVPFGSISGEYGSYNYARTTVDVNQPLSDRLYFRFNGAWETEMQYVKPFEGRIFSVNPALTAKLTDYATLTLDYQYYNREEKPWALMRQSANVPTAAYLGPAFAADSVPSGAQKALAPVTKMIATLVATVGQQQVTTREIAGVPNAVAVAASDFLPTVGLTLAFDGARTFTWAPVDIGADATNLHLEYDAPTARIVWDVVLPPDSTGTIIPALGGDLATLVQTPTASDPTTLQYVQAAPPVGFDVLVAGGLYVEARTGPSTIAPVPSDGELRTTRVTGF